MNKKECTYCELQLHDYDEYIKIGTEDVCWECVMEYFDHCDSCSNYYGRDEFELFLEEHGEEDYAKMFCNECLKKRKEREVEEMYRYFKEEGKVQ